VILPFNLLTCIDLISVSNFSRIVLPILVLQASMRLWRRALLNLHVNLLTPTVHAVYSIRINAEPVLYNVMYLRCRSRSRSARGSIVEAVLPRQPIFPDVTTCRWRVGQRTGQIQRHSVKDIWTGNLKPLTVSCYFSVVAYRHCRWIQFLTLTFRVDGQLLRCPTLRPDVFIPMRSPDVPRGRWISRLLHEKPTIARNALIKTLYRTIN